MERERFEQLVEMALAEIPKKFRKLLDNLAVIVEEKAKNDVYKNTGTSPMARILGTYHGIPYKHRGPFYGNFPPDMIVIYQKPIEDICTSEEDIQKKIREVVFHEVGHYFGLTEEELRDIENNGAW
jgi:predicted Zn-dependent protease with MMP-like domain